MTNLWLFQDLRNFRISRALQCQVQKTVLPKEEWTTYEDNLKNGNYLTPYIEEILKEEQERADWNKLWKFPLNPIFDNLLSEILYTA